MPYFASAEVMNFQLPFRYASLYFGNSVLNRDSSVNGPAGLSLGVNGSTFHFSISSVSPDNAVRSVCLRRYSCPEVTYMACLY